MIVTMIQTGHKELEEIDDTDRSQDSIDENLEEIDDNKNLEGEDKDDDLNDKDDDNKLKGQDIDEDLEKHKIHGIVIFHQLFSPFSMSI